jgi:hypothetical protein
LLNGLDRGKNATGFDGNFRQLGQGKYRSPFFRNFFRLPRFNSKYSRLFLFLTLTAVNRILISFFLVNPPMETTVETFKVLVEPAESIKVIKRNGFSFVCSLLIGKILFRHDGSLTHKIQLSSLISMRFLSTMGTFGYQTLTDEPSELFLVFVNEHVSLLICGSSVLQEAFCCVNNTPIAFRGCSLKRSL